MAASSQRQYLWPKYKGWYIIVLNWSHNLCALVLSILNIWQWKEGVGGALGLLRTAAYISSWMFKSTVCADPDPLVNRVLKEGRMNMVCTHSTLSFIQTAVRMCVYPHDGTLLFCVFMCMCVWVNKGTASAVTCFSGAVAVWSITVPLSRSSGAFSCIGSWSHWRW